MAVSLFALGFFPALLLSAALFDLTTFTIPNSLPAAMLILFAAFLAIMALTGHAIGWHQTVLHLGAGIVGLGIGIGMFWAGWIGGGDAKIYAMACLWLGLTSMLEYTVVASFAGGVLTLALLILRQYPLPAFLARPWLLRLADPKAGVPYGVALALGAIAVLPDTDLLRVAVAY